MNQRARMRSRVGMGAQGLAAAQQPVTGGSGSNITVIIDELILEGVPESQRVQIADAMQRELSGIIRARGFPSALMNLHTSQLDSVAGGQITFGRLAARDSLINRLSQVYNLLLDFLN